MQPIYFIFLLWHKYSAPLQHRRNWFQSKITASCRPSRANGGAPIPVAFPQPSIHPHWPVPIGSNRPIKPANNSPQSYFLTNTPSSVSLTCPSKPFSNRQVNTCETVPSFLNILPSLPRHFQTDTPSQSLWDSPVIPYQLTCLSKPFSNQHSNPSAVSQSCHSSIDYLTLQAILGPTLQSPWASPVITHQITFPSKPFLNRRAKRCEPVLSFLIGFIIHQWLLCIKQFFSAYNNAYSDAFFSSRW